MLVTVLIRHRLPATLAIIRAAMSDIYFFGVVVAQVLLHLVAAAIAIQPAQNAPAHI